MLSFLVPIVAAQFVLWSDRLDFWNPDIASDQTKELKEIGQIATIPKFSDYEGKRVLMLIHGFNNEAGSALTTYQQVHEQFSRLMDPSGGELYDIVIGYLWPGDNERLEYFTAKKNAEALSRRMNASLGQLTLQAARVDLFAHSMGNRLIFEALKRFPENPMNRPIHNFYSLAPAVDNESLEKGEDYYPSTKQCENIFVFHSERDDVLKYLYVAAEWDLALGFKGEECSRHVPKNVQFIDCTAFVGGHSEYFRTLPVYQFIEYQYARLIPSSAMHLKLLGNGLVDKR